MESLVVVCVIVGCLPMAQVKKPTLLNIRRGRKLFKVIDRKLVVLGIKELNVPMAQVKRPTKAYLF